MMLCLCNVNAAESFHTFVSLISEFPSLKEKSRFVFVPGPRDPGPGPILPRYHLAVRVMHELVFVKKCFIRI